MKKIMFNDRFGLTQSVLEGRKTMTRRLINASPSDEDYINRVCDLDLCEPFIIEKYSKYQIDETVAVAQSYKSIHNEMMSGDFCNGIYDSFRNAMVAGTKGWNNKMFVRAELMPHHIQITGINVEHLQEISDEDCIKEGIIIEHPDDRYYRYGYTHSKRNYHTPQEAFAALIDKVSGKGTWEKNHYVFVYEFIRID